MKSLTEKAYAKINLSLDVLQKRTDGYHDVSMIMQTINLYDTLTFTKEQAPGIHLSTNISYIPTDERNLVVKIAKHLFQTYNLPGGLAIKLTKFIPVAAGMAGGSTDGAATLRAMNKLYDLGLTLDQLADIGKPFGADIPYCVYGGTYLAEGIGEILTPLPPCPPLNVLIVKPKISVSTPLVYSTLKANELTDHPDTDKLIQFLDKGDSTGLASHLMNVLETVTIPLYPIINEIKQEMVQNGAIGSLMSGSGPTVFGLFDDKDTLTKTYQLFKNKKQFFTYQTNEINGRMY